ncbi:MAG: GNAT family N-acetyltransferase [Desulfatitalea sp.]|nr:GNAT family N-acetyltransferase [Desulfatitalea sp.]NNJ99972.1 GNAT family N-acetyltransferase [Desulfatitalea sp.]
MTAINIRLHRCEDDSQIFDMQQMVYPDHPLYRDRSLTAKYWQWRYFSNPAIQSFVFVATVDGGKTIAGMRPLSIVSVKVGQRIRKALWLTAVITHPAYRKRGIFSALVKHSLQHAKDMGVDIAYTFPNHNSYPIYQKKPQWRTLANIPILVRPLNYRGLVLKSFRRVLGAAENHEIRQTMPSFADADLHNGDSSLFQLRMTRHVDHEYTRLWDNVSQEIQVALPRNRDYLKWRYLDCPVLPYELIEARDAHQRLLGYTVIGLQNRQGMAMGLVVDLLFYSNATRAAQSLLKAGLRRLKALGADLACALPANNPRLRRLLARQGLRPLPNFIRGGRVNFIGTIINPGLASDDPFLNFDNWYLTWGDTDNA